MKESGRLSVLILSREEAEQNRLIYLDMIDGARILLDRDGFFRSCLDAFQRRVRELRARKVPRGGAWYCDLKPDLKPGETVRL
jgi:hypothetical protein